MFHNTMNTSLLFFNKPLRLDLFPFTGRNHMLSAICTCSLEQIKLYYCAVF